CSMSTRPNQPRWASYCARPSSTLGVQIFVATVVPSRRPSSAAPRDASAPPYIGDESNTSTPESSAAATTARARTPSRSNVRYVPSPTTGPSLRRSNSAGPASDADERERHLDHAFEIRDRDVLVRRVDLHHPV